VDDIDWGRKTIGHTYAIGRKTAEREELAQLLMKLCYKVGRRMRKQGFCARGIHLSLAFQNRQWWGKSHDTHAIMYSNQDIFFHAHQLLAQIIIPDVATNIAVSVYGLMAIEPEQLSLFGGTRLDQKLLTDAQDVINNRYGEFTVMPAIMAGMEDLILERIAFGSVKDYL
jgi:DNA polymerase-4